MEKSAKCIVCRLQSVLLLLQESAEHGELDSSVYADVLEVANGMTADLMIALDREEVMTT